MIKNSTPSTIAEAKNLLLKAYETTYGIFNHYANESEPVIMRPLAAIALHPTERVGGPRSFIDEAMDLFIRFKVSHHTGCSFIDWLDLPVHIAEGLLTQVTSASEREHNFAAGLITK